MVTCSKISATTSTLTRAAALRRDGARRELLFPQRDNAALGGRRIDLCTYQTGFSTDGYASVTLPSSTYKFTIATATGVYIDLISIMTVH